MHKELKTAAKNVNHWSGTTTLMPPVGGFVADDYTGRFYMVLFSSFVHLVVNLLFPHSQCAQHCSISLTHLGQELFFFFSKLFI